MDLGVCTWRITMGFFNKLFNREKLEDVRKLKEDTRRLEEKKQELENEIAELIQERIRIEERKIEEIKKEEFEEQNRIETLKNIENIENIEDIDKLADKNLSEEEYNYLNEWGLKKRQVLIVEPEENEKILLEQVNKFQNDLYNDTASFNDLLDNSFDNSYKFFDSYNIYKFYDFYMDNEYYKFCDFNDFFEFFDIYYNHIIDKEDVAYYLKLIFDDGKNKSTYPSLEELKIISYYKTLRCQ